MQHLKVKKIISLVKKNYSPKKDNLFCKIAKAVHVFFSIILILEDHFQ